MLFAHIACLQCWFTVVCNVCKRFKPPRPLPETRAYNVIIIASVKAGFSVEVFFLLSVEVSVYIFLCKFSNVS